jgi:hypothetical protein
VEGFCGSFLATRTLCTLLTFASILRSLEAFLTLFARSTLVKGKSREKTHQTEKQGDSKQLDFPHNLTSL